MVKGFKETELGIIPDDWDIKNIGDIAYVVGGGTPSTFNKKFWNGEINWFTPTEIGAAKYACESKRKITIEGLNNSSARILPVGTVLLTSRASIGEISILAREGSTNQGFQNLIAKNEIDNEFLYYLIITLKNVLLKNASGSTFLEISPSKIKAISVILPATKVEQSAIATALSDIDKLISNLEKLIAKKRAFKQGVMQGLMKPKENWRAEKLEALTTVFTKQTGFDYTAYIKPSLVEKRSDFTIPFIQNKDFNNKWINYSTDYYIPKNIAIKFPRILLNEKCLLISISGSVGNVGVFESNEQAFVGGAIAVLKFKDTLLIDWVMYYFNSEEGQRKLLGNVKSSSHQNLILDDIRRIEVPIPPPEDQISLVQIFSDIDNEIQKLERKLAKYKMLKQGMMQNLLTSKIRLI